MSPRTARRKPIVAPGVAVLAAVGLLALPACAYDSPDLSSSPDDLAGASPGAGGLSGVVASRSPATDPAPATGPGVQATADWYDFGTPAQVVSRVEIPEDGVTLVTLSNGVKLNLKPTRFVADEVLVSVLIDGGLRSLASDSQPAAELGEQMFVASGVGLKTRDELIGAFGPAASSIEFTMYDPYFTLDAHGQTRDLDGLLQVMSAYLTDPAWRADTLEVTKDAEVEAWNEIRRLPHIWLHEQLNGAVRGDPRWSAPTNAEIESVGIDDVRQTLGASWRLAPSRSLSSATSIWRTRYRPWPHVSAPPTVTARRTPSRRRSHPSPGQPSNRFRSPTPAILTASRSKFCGRPKRFRRTPETIE